jgi:hypothetical protein
MERRIRLLNGTVGRDNLNTFTILHRRRLRLGIYCLNMH